MRSLLFAIFFFFPQTEVTRTLIGIGLDHPHQISILVHIGAFAFGNGLVRCPTSCSASRSVG